MEYKILHDDSVVDFWDFEEGITFISGHRDYSSRGTKLKLIDFSDMSEVKAEFKDKVIVPVYAYIHSGIALSLGEFNCRWDSGIFGLLVFEKDEFGENNQELKGFITAWEAWLNGEVYGYQVLDDRGEVLDSCWGFIGYDNCEEAAKESLTHCVNAAKIERTNRIKTLIRNRVPLEVRLKGLA